MEIKRKEDKPMVIHTKEKTKLHVKGTPETKIKGRNVLTVQRGPKVADGETKEPKKAANGIKASGKGMKAKTAQGKKDGMQAGKSEFREEIRKSMQQENRRYAIQKQSAASHKISKERENSAESGLGGAVAAAGAKTALDQLEGSNEIYDSYRIADTVARPVRSAARSGRDLYRKQAAKKRIKQVRPGAAVRKKVEKAAKETTKEAAKQAAQKTAKTAAETTAAAAGTAAGTAATGAGGVLVGAAAGEVVGRELDKRDLNHSTRNRMIQLFISKLRQEENQDSVGKALKDIVMMRVSLAMKYVVKYAGLFFLGLFLVLALLALPVIVVIAVIYNSPFAIFFPSISSGETTQQVLSAYVAEFNSNVEQEVEQHTGYDKSEKVYVNYTAGGIPDNYCDILAVYMVKHGDGDTATDMTDKAKKNLKKIFDDMCSYTISSGTETETDEEGNAITYTVKYVNVTLRTYQDMISVYGFNQEQQDMLAELMKPENLAMMGYDAPGGGQSISPEQYQAIVDAVSDANGKKVVEFALSKVGYPYSQPLRDSGTHFDCSSLAYYAWKHAGVSILYQGSNTAAYEGKLCYDNNWLVHYDEMQPGDLIFYSYEKNGQFMNISHVAIYVGDGMVVEAANTRIGVVYRPVQGKNSIVMIGRPR